MPDNTYSSAQMKSAAMVAAIAGAIGYAAGGMIAQQVGGATGAPMGYAAVAATTSFAAPYLHNYLMNMSLFGSG